MITFWSKMRAKFKLVPPLLNVGENIFHDRKFLITSFQSILNFFYERTLKNTKNIDFTFIQAACQYPEKSSIYIFYFRLLHDETKNIRFSDFEKFNLLLLDKIWIENRANPIDCSFFSMLSKRLLSKPFFFNFLLELEFSCENDVTFSFYKYDVIRIFLKIILSILSILDDQSMIEHECSIIKAKIDSIGDIFGIFLCKTDIEGNQFTKIDKISECYELVNINSRIGCKLMNKLIDVDLQNCRSDLRQRNPIIKGYNKLILTKKKIQSRLDLASLTKKFINTKNMELKNKELIIVNSPFFFVCELLTKDINIFQNLIFCSKIIKKYWCFLHGKFSHLCNHILFATILSFFFDYRIKIIKIFSIIHQLFLSRIENFFFCFICFCQKFFLRTNFFLEKLNDLLSDIIVLSLNNNFIYLKWKKIMVRNFNAKGYFFLAMISNKMKMSNAIIYDRLNTPMTLSANGKIFFKKKTNLSYLKYLYKFIVEEKNHLNDKKLLSQITMIFTKHVLYGFSLFLFAILTAKTPMSSQIIVFEKYQIFLKSLADSKSKKLIGIRALFILKSRFHFLSIKRLLENLISYQIIDLVIASRAFLIEDFAQKNNLNSFLETIDLLNEILIKKKTVAFVDKKILKLFISNLNFEEKKFTQNAYANLNRAKVIFLSQIQQLKTSIFENINLFINKINFRLEENFFCFRDICQFKDFWCLLQFLFFLYKKIRNEKLIFSLCNIRINKNKYLFKII